MASFKPVLTGLWRAVVNLTRAPSPLPFADQRGHHRAGSVASVCFARIGGRPQRLVIRGARPGTPLLLFVHGGPGASLSNAWFRRFNAALEEDFTVVTWDQRGAGRTRGQPAVSVAHAVQDLHEVIVWLRTRFPGQGVLLVAHSWGSVLGLHYAAAHPEQLLGYVGVGQVTDMPRSEARSYAWVMQEAQRRRHRAALRALTRIGAPPYGVRAVMTQRTWLSLLGGDLHAPLRATVLLREALRTPEFNAWDLWLHLQGSLRSSRALWPEFAAVNLNSLRVFAVPLWFAQGRHDQVIGGSELQAYVKQLKAPQVRLMWFEGSGHDPFFEEPVQFNQWLRTEVLAHLLHAEQPQQTQIEGP
ncbi:alpha/beta hydrolase (plasmid) [Deinococcus taeanensis]|uniref:alpha/beta fold hydrolase n=1 Tax=Deinococcus taeanensis TaxID=2737050 RepID=UPI001CDC2EB3|nr:alpha/beta hydrolase [Deinococcus taeanensis]UBV44729.1 alpha/beta hydrolase [Deinococcus taeanensis]